MRSIQFRRNLCSQTAAAQGGGGKLGVGSGGEKVSTEREEHFALSVVHCLDCPDRVESMITRWLEIELSTQLVQKRRNGSLPDSHRAITLHVAVPTHRTQSCAGFSDLAPQKHQVYDLLNVRNRIPVLRETHGPAEDRAFGFNKDVRSLFYLFSRNAALFDDVSPRHSAQ